MDLRILGARHRVRLRDGAEAVIVEESADGIRVRVKRLIFPENRVPEDREDLLLDLIAMLMISSGILTLLTLLRTRRFSGGSGK